MDDLAEKIKKAISAQIDVAIDAKASEAERILALRVIETLSRALSDIPYL